MIAALMLIALAGAPPAVDAAKVCSDAQASALPEDAKVAFDSCVRDEQAAREKWSARWPHYSAAARSACVGDGGGVGEQRRAVDLPRDAAGRQPEPAERRRRRRSAAPRRRRQP